HLVAGRSRARRVGGELVGKLADPPGGAHEGEDGVGRLRLRSQVDRLQLALKRVHLEGEAALCTHGIGFVRIVNDADRGLVRPHTVLLAEAPCFPRLRSIPERSEAIPTAAPGYSCS